MKRIKITTWDIVEVAVKILLAAGMIYLIFHREQLSEQITQLLFNS